MTGVCLFVYYIVINDTVQDHYDWGLRAIKSVLVVAGALKRSDPTRPEDQVRFVVVLGCLIN